MAGRGLVANLTRMGKGRKPGAKNKIPYTLREWSRRVLGEEQGWVKLVQQWQDGTLPPATLKILAAYAEGLPVQSLQISGQDGGPVRTIIEVQLADDPPPKAPRR